MKGKKICIISEEANPYFHGKGSGGSELQMTLLARELTQRGYKLYFITFGKTEKEFEKIDNIRLYNPYFNKKSGWTHFLPQNLFKYLLLLLKIDADVYIQRAGPLTSFICRLLRKKYVFSISDNHSVSTYLKIDSINDFKYLFHILNIKLANCVVCQTENQKEMLDKYSTNEGLVIKNIYIPSTVASCENLDHIIWVGRLIPIKKPEIYLKLAICLPEYKFKMIGGTSYGDEEYFEKIKQEASKILNMEFISNVPHKEIYKYYSEASILLNTSSSEGFPNIFLESWANYTPIISLNFDPDNILDRFNLGVNSKNFDELKRNTQKLMNDKILRKKMGINGYNYVSKEHNLKKITDNYEGLFESLIQAKR